MIKIIFYLIFIDNLLCFEWWQPYSTSIYANSALYVYDTLISGTKHGTKYGRITKYKLKDGEIKDLEKISYNMGDGNIYNSPQFLPIPENVKSDFPKGNKAWMFTSTNTTVGSNVNRMYANSQFKYIDDDANEAKYDPQLIEPKSTNMTQSAFSVNGVNEGDNFSVYIYGGILLHPNYKNLVVTKTFRKYDLKNSEWKELPSNSDVSDHVSAYHKAINVEDKYLLVMGGVYVTARVGDEPIVQNNSTMFYYDLGTLKRYNFTSGRWDTKKTSSSDSSLANLKSGRYGFSATYHEGKVYIYGGIESENSSERKGAMLDKEKNSPYLGILDTNTYNWEWFHPTNSKGEKVSRGLAFHDSMIWNNQLILTHGGIADSDYKYQVHAIDLDTKQFSEYIGPTPFSSSESTGFPLWATIVIVVVVAIVILMIIYYIYRKRRQSRSRNGSSAQNLQEIWATPQNAIVNTRSAENTGTGLTGNTATNQTPLNTDINGGAKGANESRMTQFYMDLPYFQHEVDTLDTQTDFLAKEYNN